jgi:hypothetical protein
MKKTGKKGCLRGWTGMAMLTALTFLATSSYAGTITGTVKDGDGAAITNVAVTAHNTEDATESSATIAGDGFTYTVDLAAGTYQLYFSGDGHVSEWYEDAPMQDCATPITVTADSSTTADAVLAAEPVVNVDTGSITGTVTGADGTTGLGGVTVHVQNTSTDSSYQTTTSSADPVGSYNISVPVGTYKVEFQAPDTENLLDEWFNDTVEATATDVVVTKDTATENIDAALTVGGIISGTVTEAADGTTPVPNTYVYAFCGSDTPEYTSGGSLTGYTSSGSTDATGAYELIGLATGNCKVLFSAPDGENLLDEWNADKADFDSADAVAVVAGETNTVDAALAAGGIISGTITEAADDTTPVSNAQVYVYNSDNSDQFVKYSGTDDAGAYEIVGLPTGSYKVRFIAPFNKNLVNEWNADKPDFDSADAVAVVAGETNTVDAALAAGGIITGTVTDPDGNPVKGVDVSVAKSTVSGSLKWVYTDDTGKYTLQGLAAGDYKMYFNPKDKSLGLAPEWYDDKEGGYSTGFDSADVIAVTLGETQTIDAQLAKGGSISGTVTNDGAIFKCASVTLYGPDLPSEQPSYSLDTMLTDYEGKYMFIGLSSGSYKVQFANDSIEPYIQWYNGRAEYKCAAKVSVTAPNATTGIDAAWPVQLRQCGGSLIPALKVLLLN